MIKFFRRFGKYSLCTKKYTPFCENKQILIKIQSALIIISNFKTPEYYKQQYGSTHVHTWAAKVAISSSRDLQFCKLKRS